MIENRENTIGGARINEEVSSDAKTKAVGMEMQRGESSIDLTRSLSDIRCILDGDKELKAENIQDLQDALSNVKITEGGQAFSVKEVLTDPELQENIRMWREIESGKLGKLPGGLEIKSKITRITKEIARKLVPEEGYYLYLPNLTSLSPECAEVLATSEHEITFESLTQISPEVAEKLAKCKGNVGIGLTSLSTEVAEKLNKKIGHLMLNNLTSISPEVAETICAMNGRLDFNGLTSLDLETAQAFAKHKGRLVLNGLTSVTRKVAKALAKHKDLRTNKEILSIIKSFKQTVKKGVKNEMREKMKAQEQDEEGGGQSDEKNDGE